ncbi:MAG TPA: hypothetical protein VFN15_04335 [Solirubrobacterales bacterium]|nr:hypothetical protein [Solirubrobacterales bacterium]
MSALGTAGRAAGGAGRRLARRSEWLARRLWIVMVADVLLTGRRHWRRLDDRERSRLLELARKSQGRPGANLSAAERREATRLLDKLGHVELAGTLAQIVLPFRPLSKVATRLMVGRRRAASAEAAAEAS